MTRRLRGTGPGAAFAALGTVLALAGCGGAGASPPPAPSGSASGTAQASPPAADRAGVSGFRSPRTYPAVAVPVRLRIPALGVDAPLERLGLEADGSITAPHRWGDAGWYEAGPRPGQPGPAVLLGHVDSRTGPAVFYRLAAAPAGTEVLIDRADGSTVRFSTRARLQVAKSRFPADLVYAPTLAPSLRLVTCGGQFDRHSGHYRDNVVVTAVPSEATP